MLSFTNKHKRRFSFAMTVLLVLSMILPMPQITHALTAPALLAKWDSFTASTLVANDGIEANKGNSATVISAVGADTAYTYQNGGLNNNAIGTSKWKTDTSYWMVKFSTKDYRDIKISSMQGSSPTGPQSFILEYSLDTSVWNSVYSYNVGSTSASPIDYATGTLSGIGLPAGANDQPSVYVRWRVDPNSKAVNGSAIATTGTSRIANISVMGTSVLSGPVGVTSVSLDKTTMPLSIGGTGTLAAAIQPANATNQTVEWTTSDPAVATVNNGVVTAVGAGTATITVTTADGNRQASAVVNVSAAPIAVTGVTLNKTAFNLTVGASDQLTATVKPDTASNKAVSWSSDDTGIATVDGSGKVTAVGVGTTTITAKTADGGFTATASVKVALPKSADPVISKISFPAADKISGSPGAVPAGAQVTLYFNDNTVVGTTIAGADGSFAITFGNPSSLMSFYISALEAGKDASNKVALLNSGRVQPGDVVFSQLYVNGGNSGAFYDQKFVELYNTTERDINLNGWSIGYTAAGTMNATTMKPLTGTIRAHGYFLIGGTKGTTCTTQAQACGPLPVTVDVDLSSGGLNPSGTTGGAIVLSQSTGSISTATDVNLVDVIAYSNAASTNFKNPLYWGQPFISDVVGSGTITRKTEVGSDPKAAFGLGNGWFTQEDTSTNYVMFAPLLPSNPIEVVVRNSKSMEMPDASKISFDGGTSVSGQSGSVPANAAVKAYMNNGGAIALAGQAAAGADGSFTLTVANSGSKQSVYITHTAPYSLKSVTTKESGYARVDSASYGKPAVMNIGDLRVNDANGFPVHVGYKATIEGVVTSANGSLGKEKTSFYIQDATGAIAVIGAADPSASITVGSKVRVAGKMAFTAGTAQFAADSITDLGAGSAPSAASVTLDKLGNYTSAEALEGKLVSVRGKVTNIPSAGPDYNVTITDDSGSTAIVKIVAATGIDINKAIALGDTITFTGPVGQSKINSPYTGGYYVMPRSAADIRGDLQLNHVPMTKTYIGLDTSVKAAAKYADSVTLYYKNQGDSSYTTLQMAAGDGMNYNAIIPASKVTAAKLLYYIVAVGADKTLSSGDANSPNSMEVVEDKEGPSYSNLVPAVNDTMETFHPVISADLEDPNGVDVSSLGISIDGQDFTAKAAKSETQIKLVLTAADDLAVGKHTVKVSGKDKLGNASSYSWTFEIVARFTGGNHYRGTTHNHTSISHDAQGDPEKALQAALAHGYDYFAFSDHSHDIDAKLVGQDTVDHNGMPERSGGADWKLTKDMANKYTKNGSFVVFPGFEMTSTTWGHSNVFGTTDFIDRVQDGGKYQNLQNYYAWTLTYDNIVAQFNHPAMSANAFDNFIPYNKNVDKLFSLLEVGNGSGNYSYVNAENKFFSALDLGWHVAPTYGEDNHDATWGQTMKRTVIVANDLSQDSLLDAMRKMHVYFSEDPNFKLDMLANGYYMGATVDSKSLSFNITGSDPVAESPSDPKYSFLTRPTNDNIAKVELVTNGGRVIDSYTPTADSTSFTWKPSVNVLNGQQWFVVRVTQKDGDRIYSSPIWSQADPLAVKVNDMTVVEGAAIAGVPVTLKSSITNFGTVNLTNLTAHFYYDDLTHPIGDATIASLASNKSADATVVWANPVAGDHKLIVVLTAGDGNDLGDNKYEQSLTVKAPLGIKVMIDATHSNENTTIDTGGYPDNMKSFTLNLKQQGYTVVENKTTVTDQLLNDVGVFVATHPGSAYAADEIAVLKKFVERGGSLLLTEKSNHGGTQQNLNSLLAALGSSILVNNDGVFDETASGNFWSTPLTSNFSVRLHLTPVRNGLTDFIPLLDFYSGSSLAGNDGAGNKVPLADSSTVTILARGNETTFQDSPSVKADSVKYNVQTSNGKNGPALTNVTGGSAIPLAASEQLGNGRIFVAGMNAFNDKQMTQNDGPTNNVPFELKVVNWLSHREPQMIPIADARKLPVGTDAVVQGKVTTTAFYDAAYIQDDTGGMVAFSEVPAGSLQLGDTIRVYGHIGVFENDKELIFDRFTNSVVKINAGPPVEPKQVGTGQAVSDANQGQLVRVKGKVTSIPDASSYVINDGTGDVRIFVDGYIINQSGPVPQLQVGDTLTATGLSGKYAEGDRIRVRDTKELIAESSADPATGIKLDQTRLSLTAGGPGVALKATVMPATANQTVKWSTSNANVAAVDANGTVTPVSPGIATITAATADGKWTASAIVDVTGTAGIAIKSDKSVVEPGGTVTVTLSSYGVQHLAGFDVTLDYDPNLFGINDGDVQLHEDFTGGSLTKTIKDGSLHLVGVMLNKDSGTSSDVGLAKLTFTVKSQTGTGVFTIKKGAMVSDSNQSGFTAQQDISASINVGVAVTGVSLNTNNVLLNLFNNKTAVLTATVTPANATNRTINWTTSDASVVKVDSSGNLTAVGAGKATVTAVSADTGVKATATVIVQPTGAALFTIDNPNDIVEIGETTTIVLRAEQANKMNRFDLTFSYNPTLFELVGNGAALSEEFGAVNSTASFAATDNNGTIRITGSLLDPAAGKSGNVGLVKLTFKAKRTTGIAEFVLQKGSAYWNGDQAPFVAAQDSLLFIAAANSDVDGNMITDLRDLVGVAKRFKRDDLYDVKYDFNLDGVIDIIDVAYVANRVLNK